MKNIVVFLMLLVMALPALAERPRPHHRPHSNGHYRPIPRPRPVPMPHRYACQVVMVDRYNRVLNRYYGRTSNPWSCHDGFNRCYRDVGRWGGFGARCAQVR